jgi:hypothetical protein
VVTPLRDILRSAAQAWGLEPAARLAAAREAWPTIVGPTLAAASAPVALRGRRLHVGVTNSTAGQEIRLRGTAIMHAVNRALGEAAVADVVTVARRRLPGRREARRARPSPWPRPPAERRAGRPRG